MPDLETSLSYCTYCPKLCRHTCPVSHAEAKETLVPQAKMATMRLLRIGARPRTVENTAPIYGCTGCGACSDFCRHGVAVGPALFRAREEAEHASSGHPALAGFVARFFAHAERATRELQGLPEARRAPDAEVAFLASCAAPASARHALALADRAQLDLSVAAPPRACGGYPLLAAGQLDAFRLHAERLARALSAHQRVVVHCPACAWTLLTQYPAFGVPLAPAVEHATEWLAGVADRLAARPRRPVAFYHDPCYLGRHLGLYDAPRRLAARAVGELRELSRARHEAACSGGGGLLPLTMPETADAIAEERLAEVKEAGVATVVTACATCAQRLSRSGVEAVDLLALLAEAEPAT
jgi:Fe-S oxidoreductase